MKVKVNASNALKVELSCDVAGMLVGFDGIVCVFVQFHENSVSKWLLCRF
jgi:hypothetical protein